MPIGVASRLRLSVLRAGERLGWLPPAVARLTLGWVFVSAGWTALGHRAAVAAYFARLGIPAPSVLGPFVGALELLCGALLLLGLSVRLASIPLLVTMLVAIPAAKRTEIHAVSDLFGLAEFLYVALGLWLAIHGGGRLSLDAVLTGRRGSGTALYGERAIPAGTLDS
jgi:putative oxidoreductase